MPVRSKVVLILSAVSLITALSGALILKWLVFPSFAALEREQASTDLRRCVTLLQQESVQLSGLARRWSTQQWPFSVSENRPYTDSVLDELSRTFAEAGLNFVFILGKDGRVLWKRIARGNGGLESGRQLPDLAARLRKGNDTETRNGVSGLVSTSQGPVLAAYHSLEDSSETPRAARGIILGKRLDESLVSQIASQTLVDFRVLPLGAAAILSPTGDWRDLFTETDRIYDAVTESTLHAYTTYPDISGRPAVLLQASVPRDITSRGTQAMLYVALAALLILALVFLVLYAFLQRAVVTPLEVLKAHVNRVREQARPEPFAPAARTDEIGSLATEFGRMMNRLQEARERLLEQAYQAGRSEVAEDVLHNIRNALTPLIADLDSLGEDLGDLPLEQRQQAVVELASADCNLQKRHELNEFLKLTDAQTLRTINSAREKLACAHEYINSIEAFLAEHDRLTRASQPVSEVEPHSLITEAAGLLSVGFGDNVTLTIDDSVTRQGAFYTCRPALIQTVAKVLRFAYNNIEQRGRDHGEIRVTAAREKHNGKEFLRLSVQDNGRGLTREQLDHAFDRGPGQGDLHWCAVTLHALAGRIELETSGPDNGATIHIHIPCDLRS